MGRGSSGAGGGWQSAKTVIGSDGKEIDLSSSPLKYGTDTAMDGAIRGKIESFEKKKVKNKVEYSRVVDAAGNIIEETRGGSGSVKNTVRALNAAEVYTHTHPREGGMLGGTLSYEDVENFSDYKAKVYRAAAVEGTYSIAKGKGFDAAGLKKYYRDVRDKAREAYRQRMSVHRDEYNKVAAAYKAGKTTYEEAKAAEKRYYEQRSKEFNQQLIEQHNGLIAGQKKYGYSYTLERRRK